MDPDDNSAAKKRDSSSAKGHTKKSAPGLRGMSKAFYVLGAVYLLGVFVQHVMFGAGWVVADGLLATSARVGLIAFLATLFAGYHKRWRLLLASNRFAFPALVVVTAFSIAGTLILQGQPSAVLLRAYGSGAVTLIRAFFLDDVFHSFGFTAVMGCGAGGLALTLCRKRRWTMRYAGAVAAHLGLLLIMAGAVMGNVWGVKGRLNMHTGQQSSKFVATNGDWLPLGFDLRLDRFDIEFYEPDYRLMVFDLTGQKQKRLDSIDPAGEDASLAEHGLEITGFWPDYVKRAVVEPAAPGEENSVAALGLKPVADTRAAIAWVFDAGDKKGAGLALGHGRLMFFRYLAQAEDFVQKIGDPRAGPRHVLQVAGERLEIEAGGRYPLQGGRYQVEVVRTFTDFVMDSQTRSPRNRSERPDNPAVELRVIDSGGKEIDRLWLFEKFADFHGRSDKPYARGLGYEYEAGPLAENLLAVVSAEEHRLWQVGGRDEIEAEKLETDSDLRLGNVDYRIVALHRDARRSFVESSRSERQENPAVRVKLEDSGNEVLLRPGKPVRIGNGLGIVLAHKGGERVSDYLSTVSVIENGEVVLSRVIEVNDPLEFGGFAVYQSDYRPEDPTFSGFQIVRDPGMWVVYTGILVNALGVLWIVFALPAITRRRRRVGAGEAA